MYEQSGLFFVGIMRVLMRSLLVAIGVACVPVMARAQSAQSGVPKDMQPPAGMCRIWLENVPPAQQPAPTTCAQAVRTRPPNGRVIWGPPATNDHTPLVRSFTKTPAKSSPAPARTAPPPAKPPLLRA